MTDLVKWLISAILVENVILARFLGTCPFLGVSSKKSSAIGMGLAVTFIMTIASVVSWLLFKFVLQRYDMIYMDTIVFILVIASLVQIIEMLIKKVSPTLYRSLGIYLPLITTNCAILGMAQIVTGEQFSFMKTLIYSLGSGIGFLVVMFIFSSMRERLDTAPVPKAFKGIPIALIMAGIMAMLFGRLAGIV